ncbi:hypothetical protein VP1G_07243 [Cytospora mali]|uniref:Uncharacterized protein n=1 Tax=Cytospora mali TaxID=578113 RepID=A0A194V881_CYTMA|nr:hypothetical protein VP1G_07243 [Valsa mali var. pyri (nom. inval.)]
MESIQLAQMLADISDLSAALSTQDARAAAALVNANKTLPTNPPLPSQHAQGQNDSLKPSRASSSTPGNRFDQLGRRVLTPPLTRSNSNQGSMPGTPREHHPPGDDVDKASTLMALYEIRNKIKQQDNTSLIRAREKIDAMIAKQKAATEQQQQGKQGDASQTLERPRPMSRYTFPRADSRSTTPGEK